MAKTKSYAELLSEIALAIEAGDKNDELSWRAVLHSNYVVTEKQLELELKGLRKYILCLLRWKILSCLDL